MRAATAASEGHAQGRLWAVLDISGGIMQVECCNRSNGRREPRVTDAASRTNGGYAQKVYFAKSRERPVAAIGTECDAMLLLTKSGHSGVAQYVLGRITQIRMLSD